MLGKMWSLYCINYLRYVNCVTYSLKKKVTYERHKWDLQETCPNGERKLISWFYYLMSGKSFFFFFFQKHFFLWLERNTRN